MYFTLWHWNMSSGGCMRKILYLEYPEVFHLHAVMALVRRAAPPLQLGDSLVCNLIRWSEVRPVSGSI